MHLLGVELELVLAVERRGADEGVDALALRGLERFGGTVDVTLCGTGEAADDTSADTLRDLVDGAEIALGGDREAGLDHVDAHAFQHLGDADLLFHVHRAAGGLLAIAERGVEDDDAAVLGRHALAFARLGHDELD
jgi:hypothetical protein